MKWQEVTDEMVLEKYVLDDNRKTKKREYYDRSLRMLGEVYPEVPLGKFMGSINAEIKSLLDRFPEESFTCTVKEKNDWQYGDCCGTDTLYLIVYEFIAETDDEVMKRLKKNIARVYNAAKTREHNKKTKADKEYANYLRLKEKFKGGE